jgi:hypothetical protein
MAPMNVRRITPVEDAADTTIDQDRTLVVLAPGDREVPLFAVEAGYDPISMAHD